MYEKIWSKFSCMNLHCLTYIVLQILKRNTTSIKIALPLKMFDNNLKLIIVKIYSVKITEIHL